MRADAEAAFGVSLADVTVVTTDDPSGDGDPNVQAVAEGRTIRATVGIADGVLMHELAHMAQAGSAGPASGKLQKRGAAEEDADRMMVAAHLGRTAKPRQTVSQPQAFSTAEHEMMAASSDPTMPQSDLTPPEHEVGAWYVVKKGDTLWDIAEEHYGSPHFWEMIYAANKARLPGDADPDLLQPKWKLWLPPRDAP